MVRIRLKQIGKKNDRKYRIVVTDQKSKRNGKELEIVGTYDPIPEKSKMNLDIEKVDSWLKNGATMSERVEKIYNLVKNSKVEA